MAADPRFEPIMALEEGRTLAFVYDDLMRFHGGAFPAGVALACRLMPAVFRRHRATGGGLPERGSCAFYSGLGENGPGIIDAVDLVLRVRRHGLLLASPRAAIPEDAPEAPGGGRYHFEFVIGKSLYSVSLHNGLISTEFFDLSKKRHEARNGLAAFTDKDHTRLMSLRALLADALMRADEDTLFRITAKLNGPQPLLPH